MPQAKRRNLKKVVSASVKAEEGKVFVPFHQLARCGVCGSFMHVARSKSTYEPRNRQQK
ncbi:hypothetical protein IKG02_02950 [Candidatus Saccharibacteria bacterium]|nr:hypothetical protein [Candidatus Saccharibacteria bacterium]